MKKMQIRAHSGFTLIELLVVVLIIGILSAVALPKYQSAVDKTRATEAVINLRALYNAQQLYKMANGAYTRKLTDLDFSLPITNETAKGKNYTFYCVVDESLGSYCQSIPVKDLPKFEIALASNIMYCMCDSEKKCKICKSSGGVFSHTNSFGDYYKMHF